MLINQTHITCSSLQPYSEHEERSTDSNTLVVFLHLLQEVADTSAGNTVSSHLVKTTSYS